jgi:hypothetical protein
MSSTVDSIKPSDCVTVDAVEDELRFDAEPAGAEVGERGREVTAGPVRR